MSQSSPYEELKEIIIQYVSLDVHDTLKEPELSAQALVENAFLLMDDQLPSDITGLSVYHRENLLYAAAMGGQVYDQDNKHATLSQGLHPAVRVEVVKLIDRELKELSPGSALSAGTLEEKAKALVLARARKVYRLPVPSSNPRPHGGIKKASQAAGYKIIINNFTKDKKTNFLLENDFNFYFHEGFDKLLDMLRFKTQPRDIPPPEPRPDFKLLSPRSRSILGLPNDDGADGEGMRRSRSDSIDSIQSAWDESTERPSLEYSQGDFARAENDMSGYTLKEGPWIYQVQGEDGVTFGPQHLLANQEDFKKMMHSLVNTEEKTSNTHLVVKMIHSQDRIAQKRWTKQLRENVEVRQQRQLEAPYFDEEEFNRVIEERYGEPAKERVVEGLEDMLSY